MACLQWEPCCHPPAFLLAEGGSALYNMLPRHAAFCTKIKWVVIERSFYESSAVVRVTPGMLRKVFPRCGATEGR